MIFIGGPKDREQLAVQGGWFKCVVRPCLSLLDTMADPSKPVDHEIRIYNKIYLRGKFPVMVLGDMTEAEAVRHLVDSEEALKLLIEEYTRK